MMDNEKKNLTAKEKARKKSFCARSRGWTGERGKAARRRWNCQMALSTYDELKASVADFLNRHSQFENRSLVDFEIGNERKSHKIAYI